MTVRHIGVDLAWGVRNRTGLAALDPDGHLLDVAAALTDEEVLGWLRPHTDGPCLVAIDAPLIVTNECGRRPCEAELSRDFGRYDAAAHPSNTRRPELAAGSRALRIATALRLDPDPRSTSDRRVLEVYPHPASVVLFGLTRTLKYKHKPGRTFDSLKSASESLVRHLESLEYVDPPLRLRGHPGWRRLREAVTGSTRKADLRRVEDEIDAVLCAYIALFAGRRPADVALYGDVRSGYIATPALATRPRPRTCLERTWVPPSPDRQEGEDDHDRTSQQGHPDRPEPSHGRRAPTERTRPPRPGDAGDR